MTTSTEAPATEAPAPTETPAPVTYQNPDGDPVTPVMIPTPGGRDVAL